jgi:cytochrome c
VQFPVAFDRSLFIYEWSRNWIKVVHFDDQQNVRKIEPFMPDSQFVRPIDLQFGPEGALYLLEYGETWGINKDARLIRIDYVSGNRKPLAVASAENNIGKCPLQVRLSSEGSTDKDSDDQLSFEWRLVRAGENQQTTTDNIQGAGTVVMVSRDPKPTLTITETGVYNAELIVTDSHGAARTASVPVIAGNSRPVVRLNRPQPGDFFEPGDPVRYEILVTDEEDGTNDDQKIDEQGAEPIDREAPGRVSLNAVLTNEKLSSGDSVADDRHQPAGFRRMKSSDCFNCHAVDQKRVGPPLVEIASRYRNVSGAAEVSIQRVLKGSTGVWGKIPMIPHSQHTADEIREMVTWIYSLKPSGTMQVYHGFAGEVLPAASDRNGFLRLEATYIDRGADQIPPLTTSVVLQLRPRLIEAEDADDIRGPRVMDSKTASNERFVGAIDHNSWLRFNNISLNQVRRLTFRVASAGAGGRIEVALDREDEALIAQTDVEVNGEWEKWYERSTELPAVSGTHDVFIRFVNSEHTGGLMNLDSVFFGAEADSAE